MYRGIYNPRCTCYLGISNPCDTCWFCKLNGFPIYIWTCEVIDDITGWPWFTSSFVFVRTNRFREICGLHEVCGISVHHSGCDTLQLLLVMLLQFVTGSVILWCSDTFCFFFFFYKLTLASLCSQVGFNSSFPCASLTKILQGFPYGSTSTWLPFIFRFRTNSLPTVDGASALGREITHQRLWGNMDTLMTGHYLSVRCVISTRYDALWGYPAEWCPIEVTPSNGWRSPFSICPFCSKAQD